MDIFDTLSRNVKQLKVAKNFSSAKAISDLSKVKSEGIDRSYVNELITDKEKRKPVNLSMAKLDALAKTLDVEAWQLIHPLGFNDQGNSLSVESDLDMSTIVKAIRYANSVCNESDIDDEEFLAQAIALTYISILKDDGKMLNVELMKLARQF